MESTWKNDQEESAADMVTRLRAELEAEAAPAVDPVELQIQRRAETVASLTGATPEAVRKNLPGFDAWAAR